jgi:hypothetical protein
LQSLNTGFRPAGNIPEIMYANPGRIFRNDYGVRADVTAAVGNVSNGRDTAMRQNQRCRKGPLRNTTLGGSLVFEFRLRLHAEHDFTVFMF